MIKEHCVICKTELKNFKCQCSIKGVWKITCPCCSEYSIEYDLLQRLRSEPLPLRDARLLCLFLKDNKDKEIRLTSKNLAQLILEADRYVGQAEEIFV
jgi:hypothetical protein